MKNIKRLLAIFVVVMALVATFALAGCGKKVSYTFKGTYQPQQTATAAAVNFELKLYADGTLELTPGLKFILNDSGEVEHDGTATGTWSETDSAITLEIKSYDRTNALDKSYTIEKEGSKYEFEMSLSLMNYIRPITMTQE